MLILNKKLLFSLVLLPIWFQLNAADAKENQLYSEYDPLYMFQMYKKKLIKITDEMFYKKLIFIELEFLKIEKDNTVSSVEKFANLIQHPKTKLRAQRNTQELIEKADYAYRQARLSIDPKEVAKEFRLEYCNFQ